MIPDKELAEWERAARECVDRGLGHGVDSAVIELVAEVRRLRSELAQRIVDSPNAIVAPGDEQLDALERTCNAATPGIWEAAPGTDGNSNDGWDAGPAFLWHRGGHTMEEAEADARFICAARSVMPALIAEVRRSRAADRSKELLVQRDPLFVKCASCDDGAYLDGDCAVPLPPGWSARLRSDGAVSYACVGCLKRLEAMIT